VLVACPGPVGRFAQGGRLDVDLREFHGDFSPA
jgi:hypothetical protein